MTDMPYWPPDSAPAEPGQMPAAPNSGPAPVPYGGGNLAADSSGPDADVSADRMPGDGVLASTVGANYVSEAPLAAPNVNPYYAGGTQAIYTGGDSDPAGVDDMAATVAASVAAAQARAGTHQRDTYGQGSQIGDLMALPPETSAGKASEGGGFYDPPRDYGD